MKAPLLLARIARKDRFEVRPARVSDWLAIKRLLDSAKRHYLALEWWTVRDWLDSPTLLLIDDVQKRSAGLMLSVTGDGPVAWLRAISVVADGHLMPLLEASAEAVRAQGGTGLAFLGDQSWIVSQLKRAGFQKINRVVTLRRCGLGGAGHGPIDLELRPATVADIDAVIQVDHSAFAPLWWYSRQVLVRALDLACSFDVAYMKGECVGYQLSTLRDGRGHIVRLVVHPCWQGQGIGGRLLSEAIRFFEEVMAESVTVNTQENNSTSLQLYRRFSFERVGEAWTVWFLPLEKY
jgi:ribosomal-protein-alanine N-acetyltransferase